MNMYTYTHTDLHKVAVPVHACNNYIAMFQNKLMMSATDIYKAAVTKSDWFL